MSNYPQLIDLADHLPDSPVGNGARSVSEGKVYWDPTNKVSCREHRAMLCVSKDRTIWRCPACNVGAAVARTAS
jgi:hypothetical protein